MRPSITRFSIARSGIVVRFGLALIGSCVVSAVLPHQDGIDGWSLFPPLAAVLVAVSTGRLILGLATAVVGAAAISLPAATPPIQVPYETLSRAVLDFVWKPLSSSFQVYILLFTATLIGMVRVIVLAGGAHGIADVLARRARGARSTRLATFLLGLAIFFDDYANTMVAGTTMRPVTDRFRISREKLAYIVDSTAAPVAGLAVISTWIGYEVGLFDDVMKSLGTGVSGYELFFRALPSRFYCILALAFVASSILLDRDFGPMLRAERRASRTGEVLRVGARPMAGPDSEAAHLPTGLRPSWVTAATPVAVVICGVIAGVQLDAWSHADVESARVQHSLLSRQYWTAVFSSAETSRVMFLASVAGTAVAFCLALTRRDRSSGERLLSLHDAAASWLGGWAGLWRLFIILLILSLAWAIKEACYAVGTSTYLVGALGSGLPPLALPVLVVLVAAAVLDGAIFGDHCSPISDTTVLSSIASNCDHIDHVKTQIPYALTTVLIAAGFGYIGTAFLYPAWVGLLLGVAAVVGVLLLIGRKP